MRQTKQAMEKKRKKTRVLYTEYEYFTASFFRYSTYSCPPLAYHRKKNREINFCFFITWKIKVVFVWLISLGIQRAARTERKTNSDWRAREVLISSAASQQLFSSLYFSFPKTRTRPTLLFWWRPKSAAWARVENPKTLFYFIATGMCVNHQHPDDKHVKLDNVCQFIRITTRRKNGKNKLHNSPLLLVIRTRFYLMMHSAHTMCVNLSDSLRSTCSSGARKAFSCLHRMEVKKCHFHATAIGQCAMPRQVEEPSTLFFSIILSPLNVQRVLLIFHPTPITHNSNSPIWTKPPCH